jgi:HEAT repeat protein
MFRAPPLPRTLEASLRDLSSPKAAVRADALRDLCRYADDGPRDKVLHALEHALRSDEAPEVRSAAALGLADLEAGEALPSLLLAVEDDDAHVRQMAITALGEIGDPRATERLRRALGDARPEVRFQAAIAFPRVCASRADAIEALVKTTHDADPLVRQIALRMAEELGAAQGEVDSAVMARARALVGDGLAVVRVAAAVVLARGGDDTPACRGVLVQVATGALSTSDGEDEAAAIELCGELRLEAARAGLERRAFGGMIGLFRDRFAWHARVALARMGHARATQAILRELGSWDRDQRTLAVAAAGRARIAAARPLIESMRGQAGRADPEAVDEALRALEAVGAS